MLCLSLAGMGCSGGAGTATRPARSADFAGPISVTPVDDSAFAASAYRVLVGSESGVPHLSLLAGSVARQLERAGARFGADRVENGFAALEGAMFLMRRGEFRREGLAQATPVLEQGAAEAARLGQEGYSLALYTFLDGLLPDGPSRRDVETHLKAMAAFSVTSSGAGPVATAAATSRVAAQRALFDSSEERFQEASRQLVTWLERAHNASMPEAPIRSNTERDEVLEAFRGVRGGGHALVALYLRHGDPLGALVTLDEAGLERSIPAALRTRLEACAEDNDPSAWYDVYRYFDQQLREAGPVIPVDSEVIAGAAWGIAVSLFQAEPGSYRGSMPLASELVSYGMAEVAPLVLGSGLARGATPEQLGAALGLVVNAAATEARAMQHDGARRTFENAAPLLELAERKPYLGRVNPSPARVRSWMGALEADHGELDRAQALLRLAIQREPTIEALRLLAAIARQREDARTALELLERARDLAQRSNDAAEEASLLHAKFEVLRDQGDKKGALQALETALARALDASRQSRPGSQARAERELARILEHYGDRAAVRRVTERAFEAAAADVRELSVTILDAARRAVTRADLPLARASLERALVSNLPSEDVVYVAIWLKLVETELGVPSDGSAEDALASMEDASGWIAKLRAWGRGKLSNSDFVAQARSKVQRTEAEFYVAMSRRARGEKNVYVDLARVAEAPTINLMEIGIARDLVALHTGAESGIRLPPGIDLR